MPDPIGHILGQLHTMGGGVANPPQFDGRIPIRQVAYLREFAINTLERYKDGAIDHSDAALLIWTEIENALAGYWGSEMFDNIARIRIGHPQPKMHECIRECGGEVISLRHVGPREEGGEAVDYLDVRVENALAASKIVALLEEEGMKVRDWTFGCHRR